MASAAARQGRLRRPQGALATRLARRPALGALAGWGALASLGSLGALAACDPIGGAGGRAGAEGTPLVFGADGNIALVSLDGRRRLPLTNVAGGALARDPLWSPDGGRIVYSYTPPLPNVKGPGGLLPLPVTDVYVMNADGSGAQVLIDHGAPGVGYETPVWATDGKSLYVTYTELVMNGNIVRDEIVEVARVPVGGGPRQTLVPNGTQPTLSPDGRRLAFVVSRPEGQALAVADADGKGVLTLVPQGQLDAVAAPRFAPDGKRIVFSAVPPITAGAAGAAGTASAHAGGVGRVLAHGLPMDVYVVGADGNGLRRLAELNEDSPAAVWSPDGQRLAVLAGGGIYLLRADGSGLSVLDRRGGHGTIDWRRA